MKKDPQILTMYGEVLLRIDGEGKIEIPENVTREDLAKALILQIELHELTRDRFRSEHEVFAGVL